MNILIQSCCLIPFFSYRRSASYTVPYEISLQAPIICVNIDVVSEGKVYSGRACMKWIG